MHNNEVVLLKPISEALVLCIDNLCAVFNEKILTCAKEHWDRAMKLSVRNICRVRMTFSKISLL